MKLIAAIISLLSSLWNSAPTPPAHPQTGFPTPTREIKKVTLNDDIFPYTMAVIPQTAKISLIPNYQQKKNTNLISKEFNCSWGINGGFYDTNDKPLGWVAIKGNEEHQKRKSSLFNGFVYVRENKMYLSETQPETADYGVQTGPILIENYSVKKLMLTTDKPARRMVMGQSDESTILLVVTQNEDEFGGPTLEQLPQTVMAIGEKEKIKWEWAVNLDGGRASALTTPDKHTAEITSVGSWWCFSN